jgi:two-component system OmpR family response regulator
MPLQGGRFVRILLVEDEDRIASFVVKGLSAEGHTLQRAATVAEGTGLALSQDFDLIILDLMLPDGDGRDLLKRVRMEDNDVPVLIVSALGQIDDKVDLLDAGANDYLTKPFAFAELAARVRALTRVGQTRSDVLKVGDLELDTKSRVACRGEVYVDLPAREFTLLEYLMRHHGQVLTRQQLLNAVWGFDFDTDSNVVDVYVSYLRKKLDQGDETSIIETVRGAGYRVRA